MNDTTPYRVAIFGAGPSGFYIAQALLKDKDLDVRVDLFDRLPAPYGLVRYGVAPECIDGMRHDGRRLRPQRATTGLVVVPRDPSRRGVGEFGTQRSLGRVLGEAPRAYKRVTTTAAGTSTTPPAARGPRARAAVETARDQAAALLGASPTETRWPPAGAPGRPRLWPIPPATPPARGRRRPGCRAPREEETVSAPTSRSSSGRPHRGS